MNDAASAAFSFVAFTPDDIAHEKRPRVSAASVVVPVGFRTLGTTRNLVLLPDWVASRKLRLQCEPAFTELEAADFPDAGGKILTRA
jgi:hypothetical protein